MSFACALLPRGLKPNRSFYQKPRVTQTLRQALNRLINRCCLWLVLANTHFVSQIFVYFTIIFYGALYTNRRTSGRSKRQCQNFALSLKFQNYFILLGSSAISSFLITPIPLFSTFCAICLASASECIAKMPH